MDLHISLKDKRDLTAQVYRQIRAAVVGGRLPGGAPLPSSRELARSLDVSRNTVTVAYERLRAEGFLTSRVGAGTFVAHGIRTHTNGEPRRSVLRPRAVWSCVPEPLDLSALRAAFDFRLGMPDTRRFPFAAWRARVSRQFRPRTVGDGAHIAPAGHPPLRSALARHVAAARGVKVAPEHVFVTNGSQQAVNLLVQVLLEPGDVVAVEDPGYPPHWRACHAHGCSTAFVPVDEEGLVVSAIPPETRMVLVTPSHQFPLGVPMSMQRRQALLAWADRHDAAVVEDDYDSEFRYGGRPLEPLQSLDRAGRVIYVGSLSKVLLPTLRLGFLVAPETLCPALARAKYVADWHTQVPLQAAAAEFIDDGLLAQHVRRMRRVYEERHEMIYEILVRDFSGILTPVLNAGGLHLAAPFDPSFPADDRAICACARAEGVAVRPLSSFSTSPEPRHGLLLGYGAVATERIEEGLSRLLDCLREHAAG